MKKNKKHIWFSILMGFALIFQLSYQVIHVFSSHYLDEHGTVYPTKELSYHSIEKSTHDCDLCAKLLAKKLIQNSYPFTLVQNVGFNSYFSQSEQVFFASNKNLSLLRGPPYVLV